MLSIYNSNNMHSEGDKKENIPDGKVGSSRSEGEEELAAKTEGIFSVGTGEELPSRVIAMEGAQTQDFLADKDEEAGDFALLLSVREAGGTTAARAGIGAMAGRFVVRMR